jgi:hypothetical protein
VGILDQLFAAWSREQPKTGGGGGWGADKQELDVLPMSNAGKGWEFDPMAGAFGVPLRGAMTVQDIIMGRTPTHVTDEAGNVVPNPQAVGNSLGSMGGRFMDTAVDGGAGGARSSTDDILKRAYELRASQMELAPDKRIQPDLNRTRFVDNDYRTPSPTQFDDISTRYPRNPDTGAKLPQNDRARFLVDERAPVASALADRIRDTGQMDADTRYFYHSDGPIYRAAKKAGLSDDEAQSYMKDFSQFFAATSPRTEVESNLRNATSAMAKTAQGIPHRQIVGPGSGGVSERGYPMMTNKGGIHGNLLDDVISGRGIDMNSNTKPATFGQNMAGNRTGATVDTHAIRGVIQTYNQMNPGQVPDEWIVPEFRAAYRADPSKLTPNMIEDRLATQKIGPKGGTYDAQTEYPVFADIFHDTAKELGVSPAEAQSMAWFGFGGDTNLASAPKTVADVFDERLSVTAQAFGVPVEEAAQMVFRRQIPLLSGGAPIGVLNHLNPQQQDEKR